MTTLTTANSVAQQRLRQEMMIELNGLGFYVGDVQMLLENDCVESVHVNILDDDNEFRPIPITVVRYVDNPNWFVQGDDNYHHGLSKYELDRVIGSYGIGKHSKLFNTYKVWVVSSGYSLVANRPHSAMYYYTNKNEAFAHAMEGGATIFAIAHHGKPSHLMDKEPKSLERVTQYEIDKSRLTDTFQILVEPINFGSYNQ